MKICSHTIVKDGMPFIGTCIEQVLPFVDRSLITISRKSEDGTLNVVNELYKKYPDKVEVDFEDVANPGELTEERQKQVDKTTEDWILFLDDDDWWPRESLEEIIGMLNEDVDAYACCPFQVIDEETHDRSWRLKWFTKWFRNKPGINYRKAWPRDLIYLNDKILYWRQNERVVRHGARYFHLSNIKGHSFREEDWADEYVQEIGSPAEYPDRYKKYIKEIYDSIRENK